MTKRMDSMKKHGFPCDFGKSAPPQNNSYIIVLNEGFICTGVEFKGQEMHLTIATTNWLPKSNELVD